MKFSFKGNKYELTYIEKPILKEDGVEISNKTLSILKDYIESNNIKISFFYKNGNPKNTYSVVKEFLNLRSGNKSQRKINIITKVSKVNRKVNPEANENSILSDNLKRQYLANCCKSKINQELMEDKPFQLENLHFNSQLGHYRKQILNLLKGGAEVVRQNKKGSYQVINNFNFDITAPANKLYSEGRFYKPASSIIWGPDEITKVYIISALFGLVRADDYLPLYDLAITDSVAGIKNYAKEFWKGKLNAVLDELTSSKYTIINLMGKDYSSIIDKKYLQGPNLILGINDRSNAPKLRGEWLKRQLEIE